LKFYILKNMRDFKVKIYSEGGQGIKSMVDRLEENLKKNVKLKDFFIISLVKYDSIVKGGLVEANLIVSQKKSVSPFFEEADLCIVLTKNAKRIMKNKELIRKEGMNKKETEDLEKEIEGRIEKSF
jgi:Pyruvate/2-oxoacid:ferredoxin oxidoreductase gamma subunit